MKAATAAQKSIRHLAALKAWATMRARKGQPAPVPKPVRPRPKMEPHKKIVLPKQERPVSANELLLRTVVLILTFNGIGNRRKVQSDEFQAASTPNAKNDNWFNTTKKLLDAEELEKITSLYGELHRFVESRALPSMIKKGVHLLPLDFIEEVNARLKQGEKDLEPLVESMVKKLNTYIAEAKARLSKVKVGDQVKNFFNEDDYPTGKELRAAFKLTWRFVYVDSAKNLEAVSKEIYEEERAKAEAAWAETRETIKQLLRTQLSELVDHLVTRLTPDESGKKKIIRDDSTNRLQEFLTTFDSRNIVNDVQMKILVDQAKNLLKTADADMLRTDKTVRDYVRHGFETVQTLLSGMVVDKPHRSIKLED